MVVDEQSSVGRGRMYDITCPTLDCSAILPYHTLSYISYILQRPTLNCSSIPPHPTTTFFVLHWIVQPSYHIVPYHTSYHVLHWIVHPSYPILLQPSLRPTLDCPAILPYALPSYHDRVIVGHTTNIYPIIGTIRYPRPTIHPTCV